jgi:IS30 family transposase
MTIQAFDWIYLTHKRPLWETEISAEEQLLRRELAGKVREAIGELTAMERMIIERHDFEGLSIVNIAVELGRSCSKVQAARRRGLRRLRKMLAPFVQERFGIFLRSPDCPICGSPFRQDAERIIADRRRDEPYSKVISQLRRGYKIVIISPKTIIGHMKYHC